MTFSYLKKGSIPQMYVAVCVLSGGGLGSVLLFILIGGWGRRMQQGLHLDPILHLTALYSHVHMYPPPPPAAPLMVANYKCFFL